MFGTSKQNRLRIDALVKDLQFSDYHIGLLQNRVETLEEAILAQIDCVIETGTGVILAKPSAESRPIKRENERWNPSETHRLAWFRKGTAPDCDYIVIFPDNSYKAIVVSHEEVGRPETMSYGVSGITDAVDNVMATPGVENQPIPQGTPHRAWRSKRSITKKPNKK